MNPQNLKEVPMSKVEFSKYPKVPSVKHYPLPPGPLVIQEKLDGANSGIEYAVDGMSLIVHSRTRALARVTAESVELLVSDLGNFMDLIKYVHLYFPKIHPLMTHYRIAHLYGEWLIRHTLSYPDDMWRKFYVFDVVDYDSGHSYDPYEMEAELVAAGLEIVRSQRISPPDPGTALQMVERQAAEWSKERRIEGVVVKSYALEATGERDSWGQRFCYKYVLPEFREDHKKNPMFPDAPEALTTEQRLAAFMPERSVEKVYQKVCDARGGWKPQHFPMLLGMAWQEFMEEHAVKAFKEYGHPQVNIRVLKGEVERRAREFALSQPAEVPA